MKPIYVGVSREEKYPLEKKFLIFIEGIGFGALMAMIVVLSLGKVF